MLDEVYLPYTGIVLDAIEVAEGGDEGFQVLRGWPCATSAFDTQGSFGFPEEAVYGCGADAAEFAEYFGRHRKARVFCDGVDMGVEEWSEELPAEEVKSHPDGDDGILDCFVVDPIGSLFSAFLRDFGLEALFQGFDLSLVCEDMDGVFSVIPGLSNKGVEDF